MMNAGEQLIKDLTFALTLVDIVRKSPRKVFSGTDGVWVRFFDNGGADALFNNHLLDFDKQNIMESIPELASQLEIRMLEYQMAAATKRLQELKKETL